MIDEEGVDGRKLTSREVWTLTTNILTPGRIERTFNNSSHTNVPKLMKYIQLNCTEHDKVQTGGILYQFNESQPSARPFAACVEKSPGDIHRRRLEEDTNEWPA